MSERIDIDSLARECGAYAVNIADPEEDPQCVFEYQFFPSELTAYTRAVMEACAKVCINESTKSAEWNDIDGFVEGEMYAAAIRGMMP